MTPKRIKLSIKEALLEATSFLRLRDVDHPRGEAEFILAFSLKQDRIYLYSNSERMLSTSQVENFRNLVQRRAKGEPLAYITGKKEFMGLTFQVNENVLIPRPETEHLVEAVLEWLDFYYPKSATEGEIRILDLGTGCGNIALSLAYYRKDVYIIGVDIESEAIRLAWKNASSLEIEKRAKFMHGDYADALPTSSNFQVIVSNPPYIQRGELPFLPPEIRHEPLRALDGGPDGLRDYKTIMQLAHSRLLKPGLLALEVGEGQGRAILELGDRWGFISVGIKKDYAEHQRVFLFSSPT